MKPAPKKNVRLSRLSGALKVGAVSIVGSLLGWTMLQGIGAEAKADVKVSEPITLTQGSAVVQGTTTGSDSLTQLAARDRRRKLCLGYANAEPNHILVLTEDQPRLQVAVDSKGGDTTLLIQGPNGIDCNDNARRGDRDAAIVDSDWPAGSYRIWVGSFNQNDELNYTLRVFEPDSVDQNPLSVQPLKDISTELLTEPF